MINPHEILGTTPESTDTEIKDAYRKKAKETHPDRNGGDDSKFIAVREAYEAVKTPLEKQVTELLEQMFTNAIRELVHQSIADVVENIDGKLLKLKREVDQELSQSRANMRKLKAEQGRVTCDDKADLFTKLMNKEIAVGGRYIKNREEQLRVVNTAREKLKAYTDTRPTEVPSWTSATGSPF